MYKNIHGFLHYPRRVYGISVLLKKSSIKLYKREPMKYKEWTIDLADNTTGATQNARQTVKWRKPG